MTIVYKRSKDLPWQEIHNEIIILNASEGEAVQLNETASFLWDCLKSPLGIEELVLNTCDHFEVPPDQAKEDINIFLKDLQSKNLIQAVDGQSR